MIKLHLGTQGLLLTASALLTILQLYHGLIRVSSVTAPHLVVLLLVSAVQRLGHWRQEWPCQGQGSGVGPQRWRAQLPGLAAAQVSHAS